MTLRTAAVPSPTAVVGAGYLGSAVARALPGEVLATTRSGAWREGTPPSHVRRLALDVLDEAVDPTPLRAARSAVLCIAPGGDPKVDRRSLYVDGTRRLLSRWEPGMLRRLVWIGSTSALPDRDAWLDERCTEPPAHERGRVQRDAERVVIEHAMRHRIPWLVLRLGGLYGPGRDLGRIYRRRHRDPLPGDGMAPTNLIHRTDAVAAVLAALAAPASCQGIVHVVDDDHTPRRSMYASLAAHAGHAPVTWADPAPSPAVPVGKRVSNRRLKHWLGVRLAHPRHRLDDESTA